LGITCPQIGHFAGIFRNPITFVVALQRLSYSKTRVQENKAQRAAVQLNLNLQSLGIDRSLSAAGAGVAIDTVHYWRGWVQPPTGVASKMQAKRERSPRSQRSQGVTIAATPKTAAATTFRNYRLKSSYKSRWRQQLCQAPSETKVQIWIEIPAQSALVNKMAFAEQQRWITVQQKTFTKWLNTKVEARGLEVKDLVQDLSDGVCLVQILMTKNRLC
jgi:soluble lytic murein transglycosylase-like protein